MLEDVNDEIPLFTEREQETVLEGEPIGTKVTQVQAIDKDGTFPNNQWESSFIIWNIFTHLITEINSSSSSTPQSTYFSPWKLYRVSNKQKV